MKNDTSQKEMNKQSKFWSWALLQESWTQQTLQQWNPANIAQHTHTQSWVRSRLCQFWVRLWLVGCRAHFASPTRTRSAPCLNLQDCKNRPDNRCHRICYCYFTGFIFDYLEQACFVEAQLVIRSILTFLFYKILPNTPHRSCTPTKKTWSNCLSSPMT